MGVDIVLRYFAGLSAGRIVLWCYFIWYVVTLYFYFDPTQTIWLNSLGLSIIIGVGLNLSVVGVGSAPNRGQVFRLFLMPFCVSSYSSLIKGRGFWLVLPPQRFEQLFLLGSCACFVIIVWVLKLCTRPVQQA